MQVNALSQGGAEQVFTGRVQVGQHAVAIETGDGQGQAIQRREFNATRISLIRGESFCCSATWEFGRADVVLFKLLWHVSVVRRGSNRRLLVAEAQSAAADGGGRTLLRSANFHRTPNRSVQPCDK
jgi:hypothetical protein